MRTTQAVGHAESSGLESIPLERLAEKWQKTVGAMSVEASACYDYELRGFSPLFRDQRPPGHQAALAMNLETENPIHNAGSLPPAKRGP